MSYWRLFYHVVWGTKVREPVIDDERADVIERSIRDTCHEFDVMVHAIGFMPDHVHAVVSIPPRNEIAAVIQNMKGKSSHLLNHSARGNRHARFAWQPEYGILSFSERSLVDVIAYAQNQRQRHAAKRTWDEYEIIESPFDPTSS